MTTFHARVLRNQAMWESGIDAVARARRGERIVYPAGYDRGERAAWLAGVREATGHEFHVWMRLMVRAAPGRVRRTP